MKNTESKVEILNWWDRIFNRTRKTVIERGSETWTRSYGRYELYAGQNIPNSECQRDFVVYKITDRVTGSETLEKEYLN